MVDKTTPDPPGSDDESIVVGGGGVVRVGLTHRHPIVALRATEPTWQTPAAHVDKVLHVATTAPRRQITQSGRSVTKLNFYQFQLKSAMKLKSVSFLRVHFLVDQEYAKIKFAYVVDVYAKIKFVYVVDVYKARQSTM